ncbi:MAG: elongation factor P hydroxylase [Pseudomonadota bacterium]|nr:elongation factor P hydroxylase [Pseudomonadota bacterium]
MSEYSASQIEAIFHHCFYQSFQTVLVGGALEPLYQPSAKTSDDHQIFYREDFLQSALHEVAHWCLAGEARRQQVDYGYWYVPESQRAPDMQQTFIQVEAKPQALERCFTEALGCKFRPSFDNIDGYDSAQLIEFESLINKKYIALKQDGLPPRALRFFNALAAFANENP